MNYLGFVDYKKPIGNQIDFRTSTYRAHTYQDTSIAGLKSFPKFKEHKISNQNPICPQFYMSEYKLNFGIKVQKSAEYRCPTISRILSDQKLFLGSKIKNDPVYLAPKKSVTHENFQWQKPQREIPIPKRAIYSEISHVRVPIDRSKEGHTRYLDSNATTTSLAHNPKICCKGIAAHDNISFWNWKKMHQPKRNVNFHYDIEQCDRESAIYCTKRHNEFVSQVKPVPHGGLTTEVRKNYIDPYNRHIKYKKIPKMRLELMDYLPSDKSLESHMYGSGERIHNYISNQRVYDSYSVKETPILVTSQI